MEVVPVSEAVNLNGPYWQVGESVGFRMTEKVDPLIVPMICPARSSTESENVVAQVPDNESLAAWTSESDNVPFPRRASEIGPDQLPETVATAGAVEDFPEHAARATIPKIMSTRCISAMG